MLILTAGRAHALGDQWYVGFGGGASWLQPNAEEPGLGISARRGTAGNVFFGVDIDDRSSGQLTLYSLGESTLDNDEVVPYSAFDGSVLYRLYDTNDARLRPGRVSLALYGRFALGFMNRDTDIPLSNDVNVYFGAGGGAELFLTRNFSIRLEGMYQDEDAASGSLQLVGRFGGSQRPARRPNGPSAPLPEVPTIPAVPEVPKTPATAVPVVPAPTASVPTTPEVDVQEPIAPEPAPNSVTPQPRVNDSDGDAILNEQDQCPNSRPGYPVRSTGCALFDGVLSGISFAQGLPSLTPGSIDQLDFLANVLVQYPQAKVELHAHTDNQASVRDQAVLTRARLRTIGTYLVSKGVRANRLVLRSFGGTRPLYDNNTVEGRNGNNRIEVVENAN